jgi:hypothetical protein
MNKVLPLNLSFSELMTKVASIGIRSVQQFVQQSQRHLVGQLTIGLQKERKGESIAKIVRKEKAGDGKARERGSETFAARRRTRSSNGSCKQQANE